MKDENVRQSEQNRALSRFRVAIPFVATSLLLAEIANAATGFLIYIEPITEYPTLYEFKLLNPQAEQSPFSMVFPKRGERRELWKDRIKYLVYEPPEIIDAFSFENDALWEIRKLQGLIQRLPTYEATFKHALTKWENALAISRAKKKAIIEKFNQVVPKWQRAAAAGDTGAMCSLGVYAANGIGRAPDWATAVAWFTRAAEANDPTAMVYLAIACVTPRAGYRTDEVMARHWIEKSAAAGNPLAKQLLDKLKREDERIALAKRQAETDKVLDTVEGVAKIALVAAGLYYAGRFFFSNAPGDNQEFTAAKSAANLDTYFARQRTQGEERDRLRLKDNEDARARQRERNEEFDASKRKRDAEDEAAKTRRDAEDQAARMRRDFN